MVFQSATMYEVSMKKCIPCVLLALAPCFASASTVTGDTVTLAYGPSVFGPVSIVVGAGNDFTVGNFNYDFNGGAGGDTFTWTANPAGALTGATSFTIGSLDFTDGSILTGFQLGSTLLTGVSIAFTAHSMTDNFVTATGVGPGTVFTGQFLTSVVPAPATLTLALTALGLLGLGSRTRKLASAAR
jgi:hypothetical protein